MSDRTNTSHWRKGDIFLLIVGGEIIDTTIAAHVKHPALVVRFDGAPFNNNLSLDVLMGKATKIRPPYKPQVGDIVESGSGYLHRVHRVNDETIITDGGVVLIPSEVKLFLRRGEVYS